MSNLTEIMPRWEGFRVESRRATDHSPLGELSQVLHADVDPDPAVRFQNGQIVASGDAIKAVLDSVAESLMAAGWVPNPYFGRNSWRRGSWTMRVEHCGAPAAGPITHVEVWVTVEYFPEMPALIAAGKLT